MQLLLIICVCVVCVKYFLFGYLDVANNVEECGVEASSNLIHHNPWLVYLEYHSGGRLRNIRCAATLISNRHLITAAHCVKKSLYDKLIARLGEYDLTTEPDVVNGTVADPVRRIEVVEVIIHEGYDGNKDDIAVLVLGNDAPYTDFIRPICLPTGTVDKENTFSAAGWGEIIDTHMYSHVKKIIPLPFWSRTDCQNAYENSNLPDKVICAGGEEGIDTCRGDSGGPLTLIRGKTELWGVTSSGNKHCGTKDSPGIYTSVKNHLDWVMDVVKRTTEIPI